MTEFAAKLQHDRGRAFGFLRGAGILLALASLCALLSVQKDGTGLGVALVTAAAAFAAMAVLLAATAGLRRYRTALEIETIHRLAEDSATPIMVTNRAQTVIVANAAARQQFGEVRGGGLPQILGRSIVSADAVLRRLDDLASEQGFARESVSTHTDRFKLSVRRLARGHGLWRIEAGLTPPETEPEIDEPPVLTLGRSGAVLFMNGRARSMLGRRIKQLDDVLEDPPLHPGREHGFRTPQGTRRFIARCLEAGIGRQELVLDPVAAEDDAPEAPSGFDDLPVPLLRLDRDGTILRANAVACRLLDTASADGRNIAEFMEGLGRSIQGWLGEAAVGRGLQRSEFLRLARSDREVFVQVTLNRVRVGGKSELVAVLNDATELKTLEAQFVQSQKMQAIGQLAGGVAHDFNNLLTAISGHCDLLLLRHDQGDPDYADLVQINQNANRAAALVGQLLAFSRKQTLRPELLDLRDTLSDLTHLLNRLVGEKIELTLSHDPVLPAIRGDRRQLEQVLMNLVVNARDAMPDGGTIRIETERRLLLEPLKRDRAMVEPGEYASVKVSDAGVGIAQDSLQKVFEPFYTTKRTGEGTGLGLSTVYGIVKQTGGFIFVDSTPDEGSCFTLLFPAYTPPVGAEVPPRPPERRRMPRAGSGVVLLVEDEAPVRAFAARALRMRGYTVLEAASAEEALETLSDDAVSVDVFVTDVIMPGMDGPTWVNEALKARPDTRVVFVSGYAEDMFEEGTERVPESVFLPKPFSLSQLTETVHQQMT
ncbi:MULTISPECIES: ATP-binding response regulator [Salipiger]|uniref:histidine kinase n=1 Tax=Salipiger profundus TaxID=1229727 RepID=A0A1U7D8W7_9RHOB|nr:MULTISPECIES: ATP-binding protein [Salipiger]APX24579.1 two-component system, cell cycle sensor histidine kinase and response regulator CckA [Salipiger profundus]GFZ96263.1 hybrid sensor histidine kinase/response regulator [Salipiger profundus]SFB82460.1 two-component system, cell cycle sensor histidine kinase and response regulator CckA [Salipiger profundus]